LPEIKRTHRKFRTIVSSLIGNKETTTSDFHSDDQKPPFLVPDDVMLYHPVLPRRLVRERSLYSLGFSFALFTSLFEERFFVLIERIIFTWTFFFGLKN